MFKGIAIGDWIYLIVGVIGFISAYLQSKDRLPKWARTWLSRIGADNVEAAIAYANTLSQMTPDERRAEAVNYLQRLSTKQLGFRVPTSIANLLVEYVYQQYKRKTS